VVGGLAVPESAVIEAGALSADIKRQPFMYISVT